MMVHRSETPIGRRDRPVDADVHLEAFCPRTKIDFVRPGVSRLREHVDIGLGDGVGIERAVWLIDRLRPSRGADAAVDVEVRDVNALRAELSCGALGESTQPE